MISFMIRRMGVLLFLITGSHATRYFIDPVNGDNGNNGSTGSPWKNLQYVVDNIPGPGTGDSLLLRTGHHGTVNITGGAVNGIVIAPDGVSLPTLESVNMSGAVGISLVRLRISPETAPSYTNTILVQTDSTCKNICVQACTLYSIFDNTPWSATDWDNLACDGLRFFGMSPVISDNYIRNIDFGIWTEGDSAVVTNNIIENFSGDGIRGNGNYSRYEYNTIKNCIDVNANHDDGFQCWTYEGGVGNGTVSGVILRGNTIIEHEVTNHPLRGNLEGIGCFDGMYEGWRVENNVIVVNHYHGITFLGMSNSIIINNTVAGMPAGTITPWIQVGNHKNGTASTGNIVRNNLTSDLNIQSIAVITDHNVEYSDGSLHFLNAAGFDFRLKGSSSAIDAGAPDGAPVADITGTPRPLGSGFDIGAYEYDSGYNVRITSEAPDSILENDTVYYTVTAEDSVNGDNVFSFRLSEGPSGAYLDSVTGVLTWYTRGCRVGMHRFEIFLINSNSGWATQTFEIKVCNVNDPPVITSLPDTICDEDDLYMYDIQVSDPDAGDSLHYYLTSCPAQMDIDTAVGCVLTWRPDVSDTGSHSCILVVRDQAGDSATQIWSIAVNPVNDAPSFYPNADTSIQEDATYDFICTVSDEENDDFVCSVRQGPSGLTVADSTGRIVWTPVNADVGIHTVILRATDVHGSYSEETYRITVLNTNDEPSIVSIPVRYAYDDSIYSYAVTVDDPDSGDSHTFRLLQAPDSMEINTVTGVINWNPVRADTGVRLVSIRVADNAAAADTQTFSLTVAHINHAPPAPSLMSPVDGAQLGDDGLLFWSSAVDPDPGDNVTYTVQLSTGQSFGTIQVQRSGLTSTSAALSALDGFSGMVFSSIYYWRVSAEDQAGSSSGFGDTRYFAFIGNQSVADCPTPGVDRLFSLQNPVRPQDIFRVTHQDPAQDVSLWTLDGDHLPVVQGYLMDLPGSVYIIKAGKGMNSGFYKLVVIP